jgi:hypothetical protein
MWCSPRRHIICWGSGPFVLRSGVQGNNEVRYGTLTYDGQPDAALGRDWQTTQAENAALRSRP